MRRHIAVDVIELFLAEGNDGNGDRNEIALTAQRIVNRFIVDRAGVPFNERSSCRSEFGCVTSHHLDGKRAGKFE